MIPEVYVSEMNANNRLLQQIAITNAELNTALLSSCALRGLVDPVH